MFPRISEVFLCLQSRHMRYLSTAVITYDSYLDTPLYLFAFLFCTLYNILKSNSDVKDDSNEKSKTYPSTAWRVSPDLNVSLYPGLCAYGPSGRRRPSAGLYRVYDPHPGSSLWFSAGIQAALSRPGQRGGEIDLKRYQFFWHVRFLFVSPCFSFVQ